MMRAAVRKNRELAQIDTFLIAGLLPELCEIIWRFVFEIPDAVKNLSDMSFAISKKGDVESAKGMLSYKMYGCRKCERIIDRTVWEWTDWGRDCGTFILYPHCNIWGNNRDEDCLVSFNRVYEKFWQS